MKGEKTPYMHYTTLLAWSVDSADTKLDILLQFAAIRGYSILSIWKNIYNRFWQTDRGFIATACTSLTVKFLCLVPQSAEHVPSL